MKIRILGFILPLIFVSGARADYLADFASPVTTDAKWILLSGSALTLATAAAHHSVFVEFENNAADKKPLGNSSKYGDALGQLVPNVAYVGGALIAHWMGSAQGGTRALMMTEATIYSAFVTTVLKYSIREPRPASTARESFPSGHATTAFAFAGLVAAEHGWGWGVPAMAMATFVSYSRINDEKHRVHDIVAGATIGLSYAYGVWYSRRPERSVPQALLVPVALPDGGGELVAMWKF